MIDSVARPKFLETLQLKTVMRDKGETQTEILVVTTGKNTGRDRRGKLELRTDMNHPYPLHFYYHKLKYL